MGENKFAAWPVALYGVVMLGAAIAYFILTGALIAISLEESEKKLPTRGRFSLPL